MHRLPDFRLPDLPEVKLPSVRVPNLDLDDPGRLSGDLQFFFYLLMFVALLAIFAGASGTGVVMLIAGAALHVCRSSLAELAARRRARRERAGRKKQVRLRSHRAAQRAQAAAEIRVTATPRPATPRLTTRRRPAVAQPGPSPARKQRVI
ncbi:MAG TPA: hypothetical protein VEB65_00965 [Solirubrobacterales bacterium]|nr:hypothetical protein [Solirubrobacterales bacterium]